MVQRVRTPPPPPRHDIPLSNVSGILRKMFNYASFNGSPPQRKILDPLLNFSTFQVFKYYARKTLYNTPYSFSVRLLIEILTTFLHCAVRCRKPSRNNTKIHDQSTNYTRNEKYFFQTKCIEISIVSCTG